MKNLRQASLLIGSFIILLIILSPYLLYVYQSIPIDLENIDTFFGQIKGGYYGSVSIFLYTLFSKFVPLFLLFLWFVTCKHWWVHAILIPISVYIFQLISVINDSELLVDEVEFIYTVPIAVIIAALLYFVRSKLSIYIQAVDLKKEMDDNMKIPKKFK